ncbi:MAG TPA: glycosyltransferase [Chitinophagaceae bacterium]|nr:glycosyltransferase [Chitinophagaceae bacterium]HPH30276.1 glycosyltransferase [Chitinophagaceae bacterium]HPN57762.1 glycosyltransferase [Chitinophagaceae bacterium]
MNILNLATTDENAAGVACRNANDMFLKAGHNSLLLVKESVSGYPGVLALKKRKYGTYIHTLPGRIENRLSLLYRKLRPFDRDDKYSFHNLDEGKKHISGKDILDAVPFKPDVILIFWVSNFINMETVSEMAALTEAKIMWMMTDNAPLTGGCHYPWDCKGFHTDCNNCPAILTKGSKSIAEKNLAIKKKFIPGNAEIMSSSESDYQRAKSSALFKGKVIHKLLAPIDENKFKPGDKTAARAFFGIPEGKKVIFYGANAFSDPRKGGTNFLNALNILKETLRQPDSKCNPSDVLLLLAGKEKPVHFLDIGFEVKEAGYLNENELITAYNAADFLVSPSLEDSGPMMVNQSIVCGTPMLAFDIGVAMDLIENGVTGYKARLFDDEDLANGLKYLLSLSEDELQTMSVNCRNFALQHMTYAEYTRRLTAIIQKQPL